jgi:hypothetical protein
MATVLFSVAVALVVGAVVAPVPDPTADDGVAARAGVRLLVVPDPARPDDADRVAAALRARGFVPVAADVRGGVDGAVVDVARGARERVRALLGESRARARTLDLDAAAAAVASALEEALRLERPEDQRELLADVLLHDATLRLAQQKQDPLAANALRLAARLEPERTTLDPALHPPSLVAAFSAARDDHAAARSVLVVVAPRVAGVDDSRTVDVVVDGEVVAVADQLLSLPLGPHLVTLRAPGCRAWSRVVDITADAPALSPTLQPPHASATRAAAVTELRSATSDAGRAAALSRLAAASGADVVVVVDRPTRAWRADVGVRAVDGDVTDVAAFAGAVDRALRAASPPASTAASAGASTSASTAASTSTSAQPRSVVSAGEEQPPPLTGVVAAAVVGGVVVAGVAVAAIVLWPGTVPAAPPRPVVVTAVVP